MTRGRFREQRFDERARLWARPLARPHRERDRSTIASYHEGRGQTDDAVERVDLAARIEDDRKGETEIRGEATDGFSVLTGIDSHDGQSAPGKLALELGPVDLGDLAVQSAETARTHAADSGIELVLALGLLPVLVGDGGRLGQLLDNLISNALKFTPRGGRVTVRTGRKGDVAFAEVEDTGMGISAADQERLFERFFRTTSATAEAIPGIGLGLSISQAIAEAHGGKVNVSSLLGVGTTFRFEAPLRLAAPELPSPAVALAAA
jgi:signal transduction histidine kinase